MNSEPENLQKKKFGKQLSVNEVRQIDLDTCLENPGYKVSNVRNDYY
ncbi:hypothetical protein [Segetibacter sp. 3557_3]|nr:hypothetical protein [Segetibacter sp. 3557_3]